MEPILKDRLAQEEEVAELWELAKSWKTLTRNIGMHAGGVLIAPGKITDFARCTRPTAKTPARSASLTRTMWNKSAW